ncbi:hypothetical protein [Actinacidiphila rubida]|uniref:Tachylectin n=1 Tax=Actinacidiphila rubida TaxID=310780 RepID=A0A1H8I0N0_9ACTN|nr:hypothetical protein [Actinacidiphila rubida]SEN61877.1 hypothetical protein SAMN05216267_1007144 [Actinacidiphila rubida]
MTRHTTRLSRRGRAAVAAAAVLIPLAAASPALAGAPARPGTAATTAAAAAASARPAGSHAPAALTGATPAAEAPGRVDQLGGVPVVTAGADAVTTTFRATLPDGVTGPVSAQLAFAPDQLPPGGYTSDRVAAHLHATCAVDGGAYQPCAWTGGVGAEDPVGDYLRLELPQAPAATQITYSVRISADAPTLPADTVLTGWAELTDGGGAVLADGVAQLRYSVGPVAADHRAQLYAVDRGGVLWRYEGTGRSATPFLPRQRVGAGWDAYTSVVPLGGTDAAGQGDVVARDKAGVLWYYRHSGDAAQPFLPRVRVGGGWNIYTALSGTGQTAVDLRSGLAGDLVARDANGVLWYYQWTGEAGRPFAPRTKVGAGWNAYDALSVYGNGIVARDTHGVLWSYSHSGVSGPGSDPFLPPVKVGAFWQQFTALSGVLVGDDLVNGLAARSSSGGLWLYGAKPGSPQIPGKGTVIGGGWNIYTVLF